MTLREEASNALGREVVDWMRELRQPSPPRRATSFEDLAAHIAERGVSVSYMTLTRWLAEADEAEVASA